MSPSTNPPSKGTRTHRELLDECSALLTGRWIADLANISAHLMSSIPDINWVGFYLVESDNSQMLWLGPFQGLPACTSIPFGKGVCGTAAADQKTMCVADVDRFPGHIVCDANSKSEVVAPLIVSNKVIGVLDVDSASLNRFGVDDVTFFENVVSALLQRHFGS